MFMVHLISPKQQPWPWCHGVSAPQVHPASAVRRAEWSEGRLRLLLETPEGETEADDPCR